MPFCPILFIFFNFIYLFDRERSQVGREAGRERGRKAGSPLSREPDAGLNPRTLGSWPEPKAEALTHWATQAPRKCAILINDPESNMLLILLILITWLRFARCRGTWVAQWVKASAFGSGHDPRILGLSPASCSLLNGEPASPSLSAYICLLMISVK